LNTKNLVALSKVPVTPYLNSGPVDAKGEGAVFHGLETLYSTYLPKVDSVLLNDLVVVHAPSAK